MRKPRLVICLALQALLMTGCDQAAHDYALSLSGLLDSMRKGVTKKLLDEQDRYKKFAERQISNLHQDVLSNLRMDRDSGEGGDTTQDLLHGKINGSDVMEKLGEYAEKDFTATQTIFGSNPDAALDLIKGFHDLSVEKAKLDALQEALNGLAKKQTLFETAGKLGGFADEVKGNLDFHHCEDLDQKARAAKAKVDELQPQVDSATANQKPGLQAQLAVAKAGQKAAEDERNATGRYQNQTCSRP